MAYVREVRCGGIGLSRVVVRNRIAREEISNSQNSTPEAQSKISHAIALYEELKSGLLPSQEPTRRCIITEGIRLLLHHVARLPPHRQTAILLSIKITIPSLPSIVIPHDVFFPVGDSQ